jgi:cation diffusion facilitator CzcD-associated flavoprotein CzcO
MSPQVEGAVDHEIVIVGSGVSGIGLGIKLRERGVRDFAILDKAHDIGGTWRDHTYPGLTVDIPSLTFSFSFEQRSTWSSIWAPQPEVLDYLRHCVDKYGIRSHCRFGEEVVESRYDAERNVWETRTAAGRTWTSRYLVNGSGYFAAPRMPDIKGIDRFEGMVVHTSRWPDDIDLTGKRVGFIGTGATGIQLAPKLAPLAERLHVFQRTPVWLLPKPKLMLRRPVQAMFRFVPGFQRAMRLLIFALMDVGFYRIYTNYPTVRWIPQLAERICRRHIGANVQDPDIAERLTPTYTWGCKRPSFTNDFYPMFNRENVELVTDPIASLDSDAIVTADGVKREIDVLICATGYTPFEKLSLPTYPVRGRGGVDLRDYWDTERYQGYRGFAAHGYPNFFFIFGPYSIIGTSYFAMVEIAARHIIGCIEAARREGSDYVEVTREAQDEEFAEIQRRKPRSLFSAGNCGPAHTFYVDRFGDSPGFRPWLHPTAWWQSRRPVMGNFQLRRHQEPAIAVGNASPTPPETGFGRAGR